MCTLSRLAIVARRFRLAALLALAQAGLPSGQAAAQQATQKAPQFGPALNQAMAGMAAAQAALEALLRQPEIARQAAADEVVRTALAALQGQATTLQQVVQRVQAAAPATAATQAEPQPDPLAVCRANNAKLLATGHDILHLYESESFRSLLLRSYEPALGFWRAELENIVQDNDDRLRNLEVFSNAKGTKP